MGGDVRAGDEAGQEALVLRRVAEAEEWHLDAPQLGAERKQQAVVRAGIAQALQCQHDGGEVELAPAVRAWHRQPLDAKPPARLPAGPVELAKRLPFDESGAQLALRELEDLIP